ncbi:MAG TPA: aspartyl/asparaginyl beta-hydroxylase domain-containing protein [Kofleriaceae bacterium]|nr:aspartyl/asparaginyl beta-hydroxylase domain-containing protein [Kofleriaceae bacterium]
MNRNHPAAAVRRLEHALEVRPLDLALHQQLAQAHAQLLQRADRDSKLTAICQDQPFAFTSQLHLSALHEARGDRRAAAIGFMRAIKTAQLRGFWFDEGSTPPWIRTLVLHAMDVAERGRRDLFHESIEPMMARYGKDELTRVAKALAMYLGLEPTVRADPRQQPLFLYIPGLPIAPVFPRNVLPFADWYEAETSAIAQELRGVWNGDGVQPFHYDVPEAQRTSLTAGGSWDAYFFYEDGQRNELHHAACPNVSSVLARLPLDHVRDHGPEVCFSIMRPGAHILPHRGVTNARAVLHLGLDIPDDCALHLVGITELHWQAGRCFAFDDTYEHEAWNRSASTRAILLADIWNPYLRDAEREALAALVGVIGDFNRQAKPTPVTRPRSAGSDEARPG